MQIHITTHRRCFNSHLVSLIPKTKLIEVHVDDTLHAILTLVLCVLLLLLLLS